MLDASVTEGDSPPTNRSKTRKAHVKTGKCKGHRYYLESKFKRKAS